MKIGQSIQFSYNGKRVSGTIDNIKVVDGKRVAPENRGKTMVVVWLDDNSDDYDYLSKKSAQFRSYYRHKMQNV